MGSAFYRIKIGLYIFVIIMVGILFAVRVHNALQKVNYSTETVLESGDAQISLHYPDKILSAKNDASYPLTLSFYYIGDRTSPHTYEISLESPTLLFMDAKGAEITPHFQFTNERVFFEQNVYVRPYSSDAYPQRHVINIQVVVDGQIRPNQPTPIEIKTEAEWISFFSLAAASLLEISIASALVTWTVNALDTALTSRKERVTEKRDKLNSLVTMPYLERLERFISLEAEIKGNLVKDLGDELQHWRRFFSASENEFMQTVGTLLRQDDQAGTFANIHKCYVHFFAAHKDSMDTLKVILSPKALVQEETLSHIAAIVELWDDPKINAKDFIIGALKGLSRKISLTSISEEELNNLVFCTNERRRLLRDIEIRMIFPQLVDPLKGNPRPLGYDAQWQHVYECSVDPKTVDWLGKNFSLVSNPFGSNNLMSYPFYPEGFARPDRWEEFLFPLPQHIECQTPEDAKALTFLMRSECLPRKKVEPDGNEIYDPGKQLFPILVSFGQNVPSETPLITLARSTASAWMEILPFSPDAMLDLPLSEQEALLELLCWAFGSPNTVTNFLKREGLKTAKGVNLLIQRIEQFQIRFSSAQLLQDSILLSWLKIRPPDLNWSCLILSIDEIPIATRVWWLEQFGALISTLFLDGVITKAFSCLPAPVVFSLSAIRLSWSKTHLKTSLNSQFEAAMDKNLRKEKVIDFRALFGSHPSLGYFESEEETTNALITASHNSLARMLTLGNRLLEWHCKQAEPTPLLSVDELTTILHSA